MALPFGSFGFVLRMITAGLFEIQYENIGPLNCETPTRFNLFLNLSTRSCTDFPPFVNLIPIVA